MKIELRPEEKRALPNKVRPARSEFRQSVDPLRIHGFDYKEFSRNFLKSRGINKPLIYEETICSFDNVGMHTDSLSPKSSATLLIMLAGSGELSYISEGEIKNTDISKHEAIWFDFNKPHSFIMDKSCKEKRCTALIVDVSKKQLKRL